MSTRATVQHCRNQSHNAELFSLNLSREKLSAKEYGIYLSILSPSTILKVKDGEQDTIILHGHYTRDQKKKKNALWL